jgi:hypothetical protein
LIILAHYPAPSIFLEVLVSKIFNQCVLVSIEHTNCNTNSASKGHSYSNSISNGQFSSKSSYTTNQRHTASGAAHDDRLPFNNIRYTQPRTNYSGTKEYKRPFDDLLLAGHDDNEHEQTPHSVSRK